MLILVQVWIAPILVLLRTINYPRRLDSALYTLLAMLYAPNSIWILSMLPIAEINKRYDDVVNFYAGVEHQVVNFLPLRLGFQAVNNWYFTTEEE